MVNSVVMVDMRDTEEEVTGETVVLAVELRQGGVIVEIGVGEATLFTAVILVPSNFKDPFSSSLAGCSTLVCSSPRSRASSSALSWLS